MKLKQKIIQACLILGVVIGLTATFTVPALAADDTKKSSNDCKDAAWREKNPKKCCGDANVSILSCKNVDDSQAETSAVWKLLLLALQIMTAGIGILAVGGIVYGSVLYTTAGDKAEQTKKGMQIITNVVIGIVAYGLMYTLLNFLIPGGIFDTTATRSDANTSQPSQPPKSKGNGQPQYF